MLSTRHTQSLTDFRQNANETLDRINRTGQAEILTVNGQARAVILSPSAYDELSRELELSRDVTVMRRAIDELKAGRGKDADEVFDNLRSELLAKCKGGARRAAG